MVAPHGAAITRPEQRAWWQCCQGVAWRPGLIAASRNHNPVPAVAYVCATVLIDVTD